MWHENRNENIDLQVIQNTQDLSTWQNFRTYRVLEKSLLLSVMKSSVCSDRRTVLENLRNHACFLCSLNFRTRHMRDRKKRYISTCIIANTRFKKKSSQKLEFCKTELMIFQECDLQDTCQQYE